MLQPILIAAIVTLSGLAVASPKQCVGTCPDSYPNDLAFLIPHKNCSMYCSCVHGLPVEMKCPPKLQFSPVDKVCTYASSAGCKQTLAALVSPSKSATREAKHLQKDTGCIGECPSMSFLTATSVLAHRDCSKFCKCERGNKVVRLCPDSMHFSARYGSCTYPKVARCPGLKRHGSANACPCSATKPDNTANAVTISPVEDALGCVGQCPAFDTDVVVHLAHKVCSKFCKCSFGKPHVIPCPAGQHFNVKLQACDYPANAQCKGIGGWVSNGDSTPVVVPPVEPTPPEIPSTGIVLGCLKECPKFDSEEVVHIAHRDCSLFCKCSGGIAHVLSCPANLHFNPVLGVCDSPASAKCTGTWGSGSSGTGTGTGSGTGSGGSGWDSGSNNGGGSTVPTNPSSGTSLGCLNDCPRFDSETAVHIAHKDCTRFCKCNGGIAHVLTCPSYLHFNPILQVCDLPASAKCTGTGGSAWTGGNPPNFPTPVTAAPPKPTSPELPFSPATVLGCLRDCPPTSSPFVAHIPHRDCSLFCTCSYGVAHVIQCPNGLQFNPIDEVCESPAAAQCPGIGGWGSSGGNTPVVIPDVPVTDPADAAGCIGSCPAKNPDIVVHLIHKDCRLFCKCDMGVAHPMKCPGYLHFNPKLKVCDFPSHAKCTGVGGWATSKKKLMKM